MQPTVRTNPVIYSDFPDPDIIRVGDTYYMVSTTMHMFPGGDLLRSYDLVSWEFVGHIYDELEPSPVHRLSAETEAYGQAMWAPSMKYHRGKFYVCFAANDTKKTYLFTAERPEGPWKKSTIEGFYYDSGLFFEGDRAFIVHGNRTLKLTELHPDLSGPLPGGIERVIAVDHPDANLGFEGSHLYHHQGKYLVFTCHYPAGRDMKTQSVLVADSLEGDFTEYPLIDDDMGFRGIGVAQGGMVQAPTGEWFAFMFQDRGAVGRCPVIMPMSFNADGVPVIGDNGRVPKTVSVEPTRADYQYAPLNGGAFLAAGEGSEPVTEVSKLAPYWQFNHVPEAPYWAVTNGGATFEVETSRLTESLVLTPNILTQRTVGPKCRAEVHLDASKLLDGDSAGLVLLQGCYAAIAVARREGQTFLELLYNPRRTESVWGSKDYAREAEVLESVPVSGPQLELAADADFTDMKDEVSFSYRSNGGDWKPFGEPQKLHYLLDHFIGARFGLFARATATVGGTASFHDFRFKA